MKFVADLHGAQRVNPNDFGDPTTSPVAPLADQSFHSSCEISQHLLDGSAQTFAQMQRHKVQPHGAISMTLIKTRPDSVIK